MALHFSAFEKLQWFAGILGFIAVFVAAITDYAWGKIFNWLTYTLLATGIAIAATRGQSHLWMAFKALALVSAIFIPMYSLKIFGAGDVKLLMALSTLLGVDETIRVATASILVTGAGALVILILSKRLGPVLREIIKFVRSVVTPGLVVCWPHLSRKIKAPFGVALFCGMILVRVYS